jgi:hypothetical protein
MGQSRHQTKFSFKFEEFSLVTRLAWGIAVHALWRQCLRIHHFLRFWMDYIAFWKGRTAVGLFDWHVTANRYIQTLNSFVRRLGGTSKFVSSSGIQVEAVQNVLG